jgi:hypothetical protein
MAIDGGTRSMPWPRSPEEGAATTPDLAGRCGMSQQEVEEAARQLAGEGLLDITPLRGRSGLALRPRKSL